MLLQYLLEEIETKKITGKTDIEIGKIEYDSKKISKADVFVLLSTEKAIVEKDIADALKRGAVALFIDNKCKYTNADITVIKVEDIRGTLANISSKYYGLPASKLKIIGITGTRGKTTTSYMIRDILINSGKKVGMIGTIYTTYGHKIMDPIGENPESLDYQRVLKDMVDNGLEFVIIEVSSKLLELNVLSGIKYIVSVFTNLSEDHLDFHETMEKYLLAKAKIFETSDFALINADDIYAPRLSKMVSCKMAKFGLDNESNITATDVKIGNGKTEFKMYINKMLQPIIVNIPGRFNVYNSLAAIGVTSMLGCQMDAILKGLFEVKVPGRSEVIDVNKTFTVIIDYANTPERLEDILINTKRYIKGRIICVFGCPGAGNKEVRMAMGEISGKLADFTIITADNPKEEDMSKIASEIEAGTKKTKGLYKIILDRKEAIKFAMKIAWKNDTIIIAGKGHEKYQELKGFRKLPFDERKIVREIAEEMPDKNREITSVEKR